MLNRIIFRCFFRGGQPEVNSQFFCMYNSCSFFIKFHIEVMLRAGAHQAPAQLYRTVTAKLWRSLLRFKSHVKPLFVPPLLLLQPLPNLQPQNGSSVSVAGQTGVVRPSVSESLSIFTFYVIKRKIIDEVLTSF